MASLRKSLKPWSNLPSTKRAGIIQTGNLDCVFASGATAFNEIFGTSLSDTQLRNQYSAAGNGDLCSVYELAKTLTPASKNSASVWYHDRDSQKAADQINDILTAINNGSALILSLQYEENSYKTDWHMITVTKSQMNACYDTWDSGRGFGWISKSDLIDLLTYDKIEIDCNSRNKVMVSHDAHECLLISP